MTGEDVLCHHSAKQTLIFGRKAGMSSRATWFPEKMPNAQNKQYGSSLEWIELIRTLGIPIHRAAVSWLKYINTKRYGIIANTQKSIKLSVKSGKQKNYGLVLTEPV